MTEPIVDIARSLMEVLSSIGTGRSDAAKRQARLRKLAIKFRREGMLHQIHDYSPSRGMWVGACGVAYEGNAYVEVSLPGDSTCMGCIAEE